MAKCKNCQCDCHCNSEMHLPKDELDKGVACVCDNCECKRTYEKEKDHGQDMSYENEVKYDGQI